MFVQEYPLDALRGADYNPRVIETSSLERLADSLRTLGFVKPVIVTQNGLIVAGHQRCRVARSIGYTTVPVFRLGAHATYADEVRFNQLHNGTDLECLDTITVPPSETLGFEEVAPGAISGNLRGEMAAIRTEICNLIIRFGGWGCAVATQSGTVCSSGQYALACKKVNIPCRVYRIPDTLASAAREFFGHTYGRFSYDHLPRNTYMQALVQPWRLRDTARRANSSALYQRYFLKDCGPETRTLDFGCGQADYVKSLRAAGYNICGVEFFCKDGRCLNKGIVRAMCADVAARLAGGLFDVVVCDAVINAADSAQAETDIMRCLNGFLKPGGTLYISGRQREGRRRIAHDEIRFAHSQAGVLGRQRVHRAIPQRWLGVLQVPPEGRGDCAWGEVHWPKCVPRRIRDVANGLQKERRPRTRGCARVHYARVQSPVARW